MIQRNAHVEPNVDAMQVLVLLPSIVDSLESSNRGSEHVFIKIGEQLQQIYDQASILEKEAAAAVSLIGQGSGDGVLSEVNGLTDSCVGELHDWQSEISSRLVRVSEVAAQLGRLAPSSIELKKIAKRLNTINVYFAVESSRHTESANAFAAYTEELSKLVLNIQEVTTDIERDSIDAQTKQNQAHKSVLQGSAELNQLARTVEVATHKATAEVDEIVQFTASAMERIRQLSNEISTYMGKVVLSLQFHDIVRQQLEHVVDALRDAQKLSDSPESSSDGPDEIIENIGRIFTILSIQAAQIKHVVNTVTNAHSTIKQSFNNIGEHSGEIVAGAVATDASKMQSSGLKSGLTRLGEAMASIKVLLETVHGLRDQATEAARMASEATIVLSQRAERVGDINMDINIQALNAVITSVRLREKGYTLAILAQEVTALSSRCDQFIGNIASELEMIGQAALDMSGKSDEHIGESDENSNVYRLAWVADRISDACLGYENHSAGLVDRAKQVREMILSTGEMLDVLPRLADEFQGYAEAIDSVIEQLRAYLPKDYAGAADLLEEHSRRYTMEIERDVHMSALNAGDTVERGRNDEPSQGVGSVSEDAASDDWDNVELF